MTGRVITGEGDEFLRREGLTERPAPWEDGLRADTGPGNFEWWYFDAHLDDGSTLVISFYTKPLLQRNDPLTPTILITLTYPDGRKLSAFPVFPAEQFSASKESCDVHVGPNWVRGDLHRYELHAEGAGLTADLTFTGLVPPWRPAAGKNYYDEELTHYFGWLPSIPFGMVDGNLTYEGVSHAVRGTGYHDHNWGNVALNDVLSHWVWGRAHLGGYTLIFAQMVATKAYGGQLIPVFMLAKGERILIGDSRPLTLQTAGLQKHPGGKKIPQQLDFDWGTEAGHVHLALRQPRIIEAASLLITLPFWKRLLARLLVNPYYFRFDANLDLTIELEGSRSVEHGRVLYELMYLH
jgi:predicted secreted hydrolase